MLRIIIPPSPPAFRPHIIRNPIDIWTFFTIEKVTARKILDLKMKSEGKAEPLDHKLDAIKWKLKERGGNRSSVIWFVSDKW